MSSIDAGINTGLGEMNDHATSKENQIKLLFNCALAGYRETIDIYYKVNHCFEIICKYLNNHEQNQSCLLLEKH